MKPHECQHTVIEKLLLEDEKIHIFYSDKSRVGLELKNKEQFQQALRFIVVEFNNVRRGRCPWCGEVLK